MDSSGLPFRQVVASTLALLMVLAYAGCVRIPTSTTVVWDKENELIKSLNGARITDLRSQLGEPSDNFKLRDVTYVFYERFGEQKNFMYVLVPGWTEDQKTDVIIQCLLIESRSDTVVRAEIKSYSQMLAFYKDIKSRSFRGCPSLFWRKDEIERIETAAKNYRQENLIALAEKGNAEAAFALAREFKELRYLRELVARGDREAIFVLASVGDVAPLRELVARGDREAIFVLGRVGDLAPLRELAALGDRDAVFVLAHEFEDLASIRELATAGDLRAAATLARKHGEKEPLYDLAERGNVNAAVELAERDGYKKPLYDLAEKGSVDAAIKLAQFFDERRPLTQLAQSGDSEAVSALQYIDCRRVYYRARNSTIEHASDKFVRVCEGRELSDKKTIKIYRDWGAEEGLHYRIYFETTPISLQ